MNSIAVTEVIGELTKRLKINRAYLAGLLDVSERSLANWEEAGTTANLAGKGKRLSLLHKIIAEILQQNPKIDRSMVLFILTNIPIQLDGEEVSLLSVINNDPETQYWKQVLKEALERAKSLPMQGKDLH